ncbi:MAG TPA: lipid II flippase MurJ [Herpetosiphonaceae bacterium]|nr:lipid II flippase MurJ [Herpetosiphonaceae bacterium]
MQTSALVIGATILYKLLGFTEKLVLAHFFGTGPAADAYLAGSGVVLLVGWLLGDIAGPSLIPVLLGDPASARRTLGAILGWTLVCVLPLSAAAWAGAAGLARVFGPGFDAATLAMTADVIRIGILALPVICAAVVISAWYQAQERFVRLSLAELWLKVGPLLGVALLGGLRGLTLGLVLGAALRLISLVGRAVPLRPNLVRGDSGLAAALRGGWPLMMTALVSVHLIGVIETALASTLGGGAVAALAYARRVVDVPIILAPQVVARVAFPSLTTLALKRDTAALNTALRRFVRLTILIFVPLAVIGVVLTTPLVRMLFERGAFDERSVADTSAAMLTIMPGLPALALSVLLVRFNYAVGDTRRPSVIRLLGALTQIGLALWWRRWGLAGLGWATTVSLWAETLALLWAARRAVQAPPDVDLGWWLRVALAGAGCAAVVRAAAALLPPLEGTLGHLVALSGLSALGCATYGAVLALLRVVRPADLRRWRSARVEAGEL